MKCNRTLHDEFRHAVASTSECCRGRQHSSVPAPSLRPRLATTHSFLFGGGFLFFDLVWWWRARSGFSKGETDGILVPIRWTKFWQNYFLGKGFAKTSSALVPSPARFIEGRVPQKNVLILLEEKIGRAQNQKSGEHFSAGHTSGASGGGADSFVQFPLEKGSRKVYNYSTISNFLRIKRMEHFLQSKKCTWIFAKTLSAYGGSREIP